MHYSISAGLFVSCFFVLTTPLWATSPEEEALIAEIKAAEQVFEAANAEFEAAKAAARPVTEAYLGAVQTARRSSEVLKADVDEYERINDRIDVVKSSISERRVYLQSVQSEYRDWMTRREKQQHKARVEAVEAELEEKERQLAELRMAQDSVREKLYGDNGAEDAASDRAPTGQQDTSAQQDPKRSENLAPDSGATIEIDELETEIKNDRAYLKSVRDGVKDGIDFAKLRSLAAEIEKLRADIASKGNRLKQLKKHNPEDTNKTETATATKAAPRESSSEKEPDETVGGPALGTNKTATINAIARTELLFDMLAATAEAREAEERLSKARDKLADARNKARWLLAANEPPILYRIRTLPNSTLYEKDWPGYHFEWIGGGEEEEKRLRLAQFLHEDLGRTIRDRSELIRILDEKVNNMHADVQARQQTYRRAFGTADYSDGSWLSFLGELSQIGKLGGRLLSPNISDKFAAIGQIAESPQLYGKLLIENADASANVASMSGQGKLPVGASVGIELAFRLYSWRYETQNPTWNVEGLPNINHAGSVHSVEQLKEEHVVLERLNTKAVDAAVRTMKTQYETELASRNFRHELLYGYSAGRLATSLTTGLILSATPHNKPIKDPASPKDVPEFTIGSVLQKSDAKKFLIRRALMNGFHSGREILFGSSVSSLRGNAFVSFWKAGFITAVKTALKRGLISQLDARREITWNDYALSDLDLRFSIAMLINEGRIRRAEEKIRRILAKDIIPALELELTKARNTRLPKLHRDHGIAGKRATLELEFQRPVVLDSVRINGRAHEFDGGETVWTVSFSPAEIAERSKEASGITADIEVEAHHPAIAERVLDDPSTIAQWMPAEFDFDRYEAGADVRHKLRIAPYWPPTITASYSVYAAGNRIHVRFDPTNFMGDRAWIGIFRANAPHEGEPAARRSAIVRHMIRNPKEPGEFWLDETLAPGTYQARFFDSQTDGREIAVATFDIKSVQ